MAMRVLPLLAGVLSLAACGGDDGRAAGTTPATTGRVDPVKAAGVYELWVCNTAECGPGTAMEGTRFGRLVLTDGRSLASSDSAPSFAGCINIGSLQQFDRTMSLRAIAWTPTERPGELAFTGDRNSEGEYEVALNDLGGMLRGRGRWRRGGVFGEETPDFVVGRRLDKVATDCPAPDSSAVFDAVKAPLAPVPAPAAKPAPTAAKGAAAATARKQP